MGPSDTEHGKKKALALTAHTPTQTNCRTHPARNVFAKVGKACQIVRNRVGKACWIGPNCVGKACRIKANHVGKALNAQVEGNFEFYRPTIERQQA